LLARCAADVGTDDDDDDDDDWVRCGKLQIASGPATRRTQNPAFLLALGMPQAPGFYRRCFIAEQINGIEMHSKSYINVLDLIQ